MALIYPLVIALSVGSIFGIFLDYHKRDNVHKAIIFLGVVITSIVLLSVLVAKMKFDTLYLLPLFAAVPFVLSFIFRRKS